MFKFTKPKMQEVSLLPGKSLEQSLNCLKKLSKESGNIYFTTFKNHIITSDMTLNEACLECTGKTYAEGKNSLLFYQSDKTNRERIEVATFPSFNSVSEAMEALIEKREEDDSCLYYADYRGHMLTSDMSLDDAYLECTGLTYGDYKKKALVSGTNDKKASLNHSSTGLSDYLERLQHAFKKNDVSHCYCQKPFSNSFDNRLYIVMPKSVKPSKKLISLLSEKCIDYKILNKMDKNLDAASYTLYTNRFGFVDSAIDWNSDKTVENEYEDEEDIER